MIEGQSHIQALEVVGQLQEFAKVEQIKFNDLSH